MASIGLNVSRDGGHDPSLIRSLGATWIRIVAMPDQNLANYFTRCRAAGLKILLVLARESGGDYRTYQHHYESLVDAIQIGNEADLESPSSWTMTPVELAALGRSVRGVFPKMPLVCAGMASGHPTWMDGMDLSWADAVAVHPYAKDSENPNDLEDQPDAQPLIREYTRFGKPILVTEWGWPSDQEPRASEEIRDMIGWAGRTDDIEVYFHFCLTDAMVSPFGLLRVNGSEKPLARAFKEQAALAVQSVWPGVVEEPIVLPPVDLRAYARATALRNGIPADHFDRQINLESGFDPNAHNAVSGADGIAQIIADPWHPTMIGKTRDPIASLDYAADWMGRLWRQYRNYGRALAAYNWGPGNVAGWDGRRETLPAETRRYLDVVLGAGWPEPGSPTVPTIIPFNPDAPCDVQPDDWSCSIQSMQWLLRSIGRTPGDQWMHDQLVPGIVSPDVGLKNATGQPLTAWLNREYGSEMGFTAHAAPVIFDDVLAGAGVNPTMIGGRRYGPGGHWVGVRRADENGWLELANPAPNYTGTGTHLDRAEWDARGPWTAIYIDRAAMLGTQPPPPPPDPVDPLTVIRPHLLTARAEIDKALAKIGA